MNAYPRTMRRTATLLIATLCSSLSLIASMPTSASATAIPQLDPSQLAYTIVAGSSYGNTQSASSVNMIAEPSGNTWNASFPYATDGSVALDPTTARAFVPHSADGNGSHFLQDVYPLTIPTGVVGNAVTIPCLRPGHLTASPDGTEFVAYCAGENTIKVFRPSDWSVPVVVDEPNNVYSFAWSADGSRIFVSDQTGVRSLYGGSLSAAFASSQTSQEVQVKTLAKGSVLTMTSTGGVQPWYTFQQWVCVNATCSPSGANGTNFTLKAGTDLTPGLSSVVSNFATNADGSIVYVWSGGSSILEIGGAGGQVIATLNTGGVKDGYITPDPSGTKLIITAVTNGVGTIGLLDIPTNTYNTISTFGSANSVQPALTLPPATPTADFTADPAAAGKPMSFHALTTSAAGAPIVSYCWRWGDGTNETCTQSPDVTHTYASAGTYHPTLTVQDALGQSGPNTGWWDGTRWVTRGSSRAIASHDVIATNLVLGLTVYGGTAGQTVHTNPGSTISLSAILGPGGTFTGAAPKVIFTIDGADYGGPVSTTALGAQGYQAIISDLPVGPLGHHVFGVRYAGDNTVNPPLPPTASDPIDVYVDPWPSHVTGTPSATRVPSGGQLSINAAVAAECADGSYQPVIDGSLGAFSYPASGASSMSVPVAGLADGVHTIAIHWEPSSGGNCAASTSAPVDVTVGSAPGVAPITSAKPVSGGLSVTCRLPQGPVSNVVFQAVPLDKAIAKTVTVTRGAACSTTIKGLVRGEAYRVLVNARNAVGNGPSTSTVAVAGLNKGVSLFALPAKRGRATVYFGYTVLNGRPIRGVPVVISKKAGVWATIARLRTSSVGRFQGQVKLPVTTALRAQASVSRRSYAASATARVTR